MPTTICALSTPAAASGLGVIRLSGPDAAVIADRVFRAVRPAGTLTAAAGYTAAYGTVFDADGDIDECVAVVFRAPHSYTGENVIELSCHGGVYLLQRVLRALLTAGAAAATAGEFTRRAFVNGKLDLTRAEAVMDLIGAQGRLAAKAALAARVGRLYHGVEAVKNRLIAACAQFAAYVDFPDDDIPELHTDTLGATLREADDTLTALLGTYEAGRVLREGVDTVIVGSPNVGKSTLMNCLAGCERSIVTSVAGTTRDIIEETVRLGDVLLHLSDTAGQRACQDEAERIGVERARTRMASAALLLVVFDGSRPLSDEDRRLAEEAAAHAAIAIINKTDQSLKIDERYISDIFFHCVYMAAQTGEGLTELEAAVRTVTGVEALDEAAPMLATERQRHCVADALEALRDARAALEAGITLDAVEVGVEGAVESLLELTGERATEAVVEDVFSRFCVGK